MPNELDPLQDQWYTYTDKGQPFYVVDIDEADKGHRDHGPRRLFDSSSFQ